jgi:rhodanese-related sulfurtransferase
MQTKARLFISIFSLSILAFGFHSCSESTPNESAASAPVTEEVAAIPAIMKDIDVEEMNALLSEKSATLLDVRTAGECELGVIPNSINYDVTAEGFKSQISELDKNSAVIVYCKSGRRSSNAMAIMNKMGFKEIYNLKGGYELYETKVKEESSEEVDQD